MKKALLILLMIILIVFLLLPPGLRLFGKNLYYKEEVKKDVVSVLSCTKGDESVRTTYLNDNPYNMNYMIAGDYTPKDNVANENTEEVKEEQEEVQENTQEPKTNDMIENIKTAASITYNQESNMTSFSVMISMVESNSEKLKNYTKKLQEQQGYYSSNGFSCTITTA